MHQTRRRRRLAGRRSLLVAVLALATGTVPVGGQPAAPAAIATPDGFFGFRMGTDGRLAAWPDIERYVTEVAAISDRVELTTIGTSTEGRTQLAVIVSSPENIARLEEIRQHNRQLADPRTLTAERMRVLLDDQPAVLAVGASIHASEVGATQALNELLHQLATSRDPAVLEILRSLVIILIPSLNPDGHVMVVDWFEKQRGTTFEGGPMPWLYHKYAGHDINRDAFMLNLAESRNLAQFFYTRWQPQVFLTMHQMGPRGPRFFVPPNYDPIDANHDPMVWRVSGLLGHAMAFELERDGRSGVVQNAIYDYYWPGYEDSAPLGHNTVCLLTEVASARLALPIEVAPNDLVAHQRGFAEYRPQINFPNPWPGGTWRLRDIVDYNLSAVRGLLDGATRYRRELVENFYEMGRRAVARGRAGGPFAYVIPPGQHDPHAAAALTGLLLGSAVEVHQAIEPFRAGSLDYPAGSTLVLMAQPYRAFVKSLFERQQYPARRSFPNGPPERPYDVAGWTLPLQMGVTVDTIEQPFEVPAVSRLDRATVRPGTLTGDRNPSYYLLAASGNSGALAINRLQAARVAVQWATVPLDLAGRQYAPGTVVVPASRPTRALVERLVRDLGIDAVGVRGRMPRDVRPIARPRIGVYGPWVENIDEGWTRWLLERYEFTFVTLRDQDLRAGRLRDRVDVIIVPDGSPERLVAGHGAGTMPDPYVGGLGDAGVATLQSFVREGGTLVCLDSSCGLAIDALDLPVRDVTRGLPAERFFCPGSILRLRTEPAQPLAYGVPEDTTAFFAFSSAYELLQPSPPPTASAVTNDAALRIVARYGEGNPLLSGWLEGPDVIANRSAIVEARLGAGRVVLLGFRVQHRAQSHATFRFLFNALYTH